MRILYPIALLAMFMIFTAGSCKQESVDLENVTWVDIATAEKKVKGSGKKVIVDVYTQWCGPCKMMDRNTFTDPDVIKLMNTNFYSVKFDAEGNQTETFQGKEYGNPNWNPAKAKRRNSRHELSPFFGVRGYPAMVIMDEEMNILDKLVGYKNPQQFQEALAKYVN